MNSAQIILMKHLKLIDETLVRIRDEINDLNAKLAEKAKEQITLSNNRDQIVLALEKLNEQCPIVNTTITSNKKGKK